MTIGSKTVEQTHVENSQKRVFTMTKLIFFLGHQWFQGDR